MTDRKAEYQRYLKTGTWKRLRLAAFAEYGKLCGDCQRTDRLQVHHLRYPEVLGTETVDMLRVLCAPCHHLHHPDKPWGPKKKGQRIKTVVTPEERKAVRRLRLAARRERKLAKASGKRPANAPSNAALLARVKRGEGKAKPKKLRKKWTAPDPRSLKDRFGFVPPLMARSQDAP